MDDALFVSGRLIERNMEKAYKALSKSEYSAPYLKK